MEDNQSTYPGQPSDEITQMVVHKHIMSISPVLFGMFLVFLAVLGLVVFYNNNQYVFEQFATGGLIGLAVFLMLCFIFLLVLGTIWIWRRNKIIITTNHIVDIDQIGFFNKTVSTLHLDEIQDVSAKISGPVQTFMKYGTIIIQTAGERENFVFDYVPNPLELENFILDARKKSVKTNKKSV